MSHELVTIETNFSADLAGQRVGWMALTEISSQYGDRMHILNAASAVVSAEGATFAYLKNGEREHIHEKMVTGFEDGTAIELVIPHEGSFDPSQTGILTSANPLYTRSIRTPFDAAGVLRHGVGTVVSPRERVWAMNESELKEMYTTGVREALESISAPDRSYPAYYYLLNHALLNEYFRSGDIDRSRNLLDRAVIDVDMHERTVAERRAAQAIVGSLGRQTASNAELTDILVDAEREDTVEQFLALRSEGSAKALLAQERLGSMVLSAYVYTPEGTGRRGRTWPYLSELVNDHSTNFAVAQLVKGLKQGVTRDLEREAYELSGRLQFATYGWAALSVLARAEEVAIEEQLLDRVTGSIEG